AQAFEYLINRTARHPLGELRWFAQEIKSELDKEIPSLLLRVAEEKSGDYQAYLNQRYRAVHDFLGELPPELSAKPEVRLVEYDADSEVKILAGIIFQQTHGSWDQALAKARLLDETKKHALFERYLLKRSSSWQKVGRALDNAYLPFEVAMELGSYPALHEL